MADDSTYYADVIRWLVAHPKAVSGEEAGALYLVKGTEHPNDEEAARLKQTSCDVKTSVVCMRAYAEGYRLSRDFYVGDRAMRESGFDPSFRFGPFSGSTHHYAPVCLNSLLYRYERDLQHIALVLGKGTEAARWGKRAQLRNAAIHRYLWKPQQGVFADYDFLKHKSSDYAYIIVAVSTVGGRGVARRGEEGGGKAEPVRAAGRIVDEQHELGHAVG